ncbi:unnamed protein product [Mesocestoides corti]|uniref:Uncharacterized protein n=1 Tax=Mesocestoides corti TaxID=53468 RepID=A0A0R3URJ7_MESCO|nr:unnamed protein product [Mesocestoides corti]
MQTAKSKKVKQNGMVECGQAIDIRALEETQIFGPIFFTIIVTVADAAGVAASVIDAGTLGEVNYNDYLQSQQQRQQQQSHEGYASCVGVGRGVASRGNTTTASSVNHLSTLTPRRWW